ncbi:hypothetical protein CNR22_15555 [Sphingobacteriaceae bacterium]|nr:hypothetical protein CNR22_15555 [Sphingobacteriaceae bacterium]
MKCNSFIMRKIRYLVFIFAFANHLHAQLSGSLNVPSTYTSLASVIADLNLQGISGPVTVNIAAGFTETVITGGYSLTASGTSLNPIIFKKTGTGSNPLLVAYTGGSGTPGSMHQDGVFRLIGCDYITIDGIDIYDPNTSNPSTMEFGYGLFKSNSADGCQNNILKNCTITLNRINNAGGSGPSSDGSRGIDVINASSSAHNAAISVSVSSGSNSYNKFYANTIQNCNIGISMVGFADVSPFTYADHANDIGGNLMSTGNLLLNFGGGGSSNAAMGIRTLAQYDLNIGFNKINNNTGLGINHPAILKGIYLGAAKSANTTLKNNTLTLNGGGTSSQISVIENGSGATPASNTVTIIGNKIINCTYATSTSGAFYGIWNTASCENIFVTNNVFINNSTSATSGSTYLIYNNGAVPGLIGITGNTLGYMYSGSASYSGTMYNIYNANGATTSTLNVDNNHFSSLNHFGYTGTGSVYFIYNTNDSYATTINGNTWSNLFLNHSGSQYLINNASSTQGFLNVCANSIIGSYNRTASAGALYLYYSTGSSPATCVQTYSGNIFSNITATVAGSGNFYGIYTTDGASSPYPQKNVFQNKISNVTINSNGAFYGFYLDYLGDGTQTSPSSVHNNTLSSVFRNGTIYGLYVTASVSPNYAPRIFANTIQYLNSNGAGSAVYSAYLAGGGAGLNFYKNKITDGVATGTSGIAHGIYLPGAITTTLCNNFIGGMNAPNSSANNAVNGIYINAGFSVHTYFNTVYLTASSTGGNYNSNAIYASSTVSLTLRNNCFLNLSSTGTGTNSAFRRSSTSFTNYMAASNTNLFYAGIPGSANVILQNGSTAYQTLATFKTALSPRESGSVTQTVSFQNTLASSPNYLHVTSNLSSLLESAATNITGITDDFDADIRYGNSGYSGAGSAPDIGADEFNQNTNPCSSASAGTVIAISSSLCAAQAATLMALNYALGTGVFYQWQVSNAPGGPYADVSGGTGATSSEFISPSLNAGTYYFVLTTTCSANSSTAVSAEISIVVNALPLALAQIASSLVCSGESLSLNGVVNSASSFQWIGPNGYNASVQSPTISDVNALSSGIYYFSAMQGNCSSAQSTVMVNISEVTLTLSATPTLVCLGNTSILSLTTSASTYTWSTGSNQNTIGVSPTVTSVYTVAVTNTANCVQTKSVAIAVTNPSISANNTVVCGNNGIAVLSVNVFSPAVVNWYSSITSSTSLGTGISYSVNTSSSCTFYAEASNSLSGCQSLRIPVSVTVSPVPVLTLIANPSVICPASSCTLYAKGAVTYSWTSLGTGSVRTVSPTSSIIYTVSGENSLGCRSSGTLQVMTYTVPVITTVQSATAVCPSGVVTFTASGANSYFWNTGANGSLNTVTVALNTTYTVYGTNTESCTASKTLAVVTRSVPVISIFQSDATLCPAELVTFTATGATSYTWLPGGSVSHTFNANPMISSVYNAIGKGINTCTNVGIASVIVDICSSLMDEDFSKTNSVFPNPSTGIVNFVLASKGKQAFKLFSPLGTLIMEGNIGKEQSVDLSSVAKGIYVIEIFSDKNRVCKKLCLE